MIRVVVFFVLVLLIAFGVGWLADHPGAVSVSFGGQDYLFSTLTGLIGLLAAAVVLLVIWTGLRLLVQAPSLLSGASMARKRQRGYGALSRGMIAVGSGDVEGARRNATEAERLLGTEPMVLLLKAQSAQMSGDRASAERVFTAMLDHPDTRPLALRGLYMEATRRGDRTAALAHAEAAQKITTLPWSATALLQAKAADGAWLEALRLVERNVTARIVDRAAGNRQRAVLLTALAQDFEERSPDEALTAARDALKLAPTLVPAAALAGRLLGRKGDYRRASKVLEEAFAAEPHPEIADAYLHVRQGDSAADRLGRAETLMRIAPHAPESRLSLARAALDAREFALARTTLMPLVEGPARPTRRACLAMADLEEAEHGDTGPMFEWLQRASHAAADPAWVADGLVADQWRPISPTTGQLDAYRWQAPQNQPAGVAERAPRIPARAREVALQVPPSEAPAALPAADVAPA